MEILLKRLEELNKKFLGMKNSTNEVKNSNFMRKYRF